MNQVLDRQQPTATSAETPAEQTEWDLRKQFGFLTASDRCVNRLVSVKIGVETRSPCGAQAFVRAVFPDSGLSLEFCAHCVGENTVKATHLTATQQRARATRENLIAQGAVLLSDYDKINLKPTSTEDQKPTKKG